LSGVQSAAATLPVDELVEVDPQPAMTASMAAAAIAARDLGSGRLMTYGRTSQS
jgi:hypothetical protein